MKRSGKEEHEETGAPKNLQGKKLTQLFPLLDQSMIRIAIHQCSLLLCGPSRVHRPGYPEKRNIFDASMIVSF